MKSDLHETFRIFSDWFFEFINKVSLCARARVHAQCVKMCTQLGQYDKPQFFSQMNSDFYKTWYDFQVGIKDAQKKLVVIGARMCTQCA